MSDIKAAATVAIIIVLIVIIIKLSLEKSQTRKSRARPHVPYFSEKIAKDSRNHSKTLKKNESERKKNLYVRTVCDNFEIEPMFTPGDNLVEIELDIRGGLKPFSYEWLINGRIAGTSSSIYAPYESSISVNVKDVRGCERHLEFRTPI